MRQILLSLVYFLFFFSGAAALIYQVVWVRSLGLVFGGTHLAVTTVLSVFMGGLALGSYLIGRRVDALRKPLLFYGILEIGIAIFAIIFIGLMKVYPSIYVFLIDGENSSHLVLTVVRVLFAFLALIVPTTLMGGTLPVLTRFVSTHLEKLGSKLSMLYALNTLGAVFGTAAAAFFLLRFYSVSLAMHTAIAINLVIGLISVVLQRISPSLFPQPETTPVFSAKDPRTRLDVETLEHTPPSNMFSLRLVLIGIGVSGFCALGYEVLWTRVLTLTVGTSVYGFATMLIAFLTGIALGSESYSFFEKAFRSRGNVTTNLIVGFGMVQCIIGVLALFVTLHIRDLPTHSIAIIEFFQSRGLDLFQARQWGNLTLAFSYMVAPAYFMGLAFPLAGMVNTSRRMKVGHAVGDVLTSNTIGAILGSAVSGFFMIYIFGIERSLQLLAIVNIGFGLLIAFSIKNRATVNFALIGATLAAMLFLILNPDAFRMWNARYFAIFQNNQPTSYDTPERLQDAIENTDVLFYDEGIDSTISSIKVKGGDQAILVNGKVVASNALRDRQCQYTLGHLPMLLHEDPKKVLVVGLGTGMTLGAVSIHPSVEELTLAEIEPHVVGAARTFGPYNHFVLDDPKLKIVFNDGRNFLMTTKKKYDVITADPIHPWTQGSGYLYTAEYFKLASERLNPKGIMCQWLPIYELSVNDLQTVVRTFSQAFKYTMTWMTQYDAEIIGSNSPIIIDEENLASRIAYPPIAKALRPVMMDSANDFLSFFLMGTDAMNDFGQNATINTDDNLFLEYSTPVSVGRNLTGVNVAALARYRESIIPYLVPAKSEQARNAQVKKWNHNQRAAVIADRAHALFLDGKANSPAFRSLISDLDTNYPDFAPGRFVRDEYQKLLWRVPRLIEKTPLALSTSEGKEIVVEVSAVFAAVSPVRAAVVFVDNDAREFLGQLYFDGDDLENRMGAFAKDVLASIQASYREQADLSLKDNGRLPDSTTMMEKVREIIATKCGAS